MSTRDELRGAFVGIVVGAMAALVLFGIAALLVYLFSAQ